MQRRPELVLTAVLIVFCLSLTCFGACFAQAPPPQKNAPAKQAPASSQARETPLEIKPAELSLGAASPSRESSNTIILKKNSPGYTQWTLQGPAGWRPPPEQKYSGMLGPEPVTFKIVLRCFAENEYSDNSTPVPVELSFESDAGSLSFRNELRPGRYKERFAFVFDGKEKGLVVYFRVLGEEGSVLLVDTHGLDFGTIEGGKTASKTIHIRNPGRNVLSWKVEKAPPSLRDGRYVTLFNQEVRDGGTYFAPSGAQDLVQFQGEWTGVEGNPLGKSGSAVQINFTGSGITLYGVKDSDPGLLHVKLDDDPGEDVPCGSGYLESTEILALNDLAEGPHRLTISVKKGVLFIEGLKIPVSGIFKGPAHWIKIVPDSGTTTSETDFVNVTLNTAGLPPGTYSDEIEITSNSGTASVDVSANVTVSSIPQLIKIFRFSRGRDVLYSCNPAAENPRKMAGYTGRAYAFSLFREDTPGTRPLYRWYSQANANHYYTASQGGDKNTRGYVLEGPIGNIATTRLPSTRELYHWYNSSSGTHTYTLDPRGENLQKAKFVYQGIVGYVK